MSRVRVEWVDDLPWEAEPGPREADLLTLDADGDVIDRERVLLHYDPARVHIEADYVMSEVALRRAAALGRPVVVTSFTGTGVAQVHDVEDGGLVAVADVMV